MEFSNKIHLMKLSENKSFTRTFGQDCQRPNNAVDWTLDLLFIDNDCNFGHLSRYIFLSNSHFANSLLKMIHSRKWSKKPLLCKERCHWTLILQWNLNWERLLTTKKRKFIFHLIFITIKSILLDSYVTKSNSAPIYSFIIFGVSSFIRFDT